MFNYINNLTTMKPILTLTGLLIRVPICEKVERKMYINEAPYFEVTLALIMIMLLLKYNYKTFNKNTK